MKLHRVHFPCGRKAKKWKQIQYMSRKSLGSHPHPHIIIYFVVNFSATIRPLDLTHKFWQNLISISSSHKLQVQVSSEIFSPFYMNFLPNVKLLWLTYHTSMSEHVLWCQHITLHKQWLPFNLSQNFSEETWHRNVTTIETVFFKITQQILFMSQCIFLYFPHWSVTLTLQIVTRWST